MNEMPNADAGDAASLNSEIKTLREDLARMGAIVEELVRRRAGEAAGVVGRRAERAWDDARGIADEATKAMEANPLGTLAGAFGIGLLLGLLFARR